jgi:hypothetical protein
LILRVKPRHGAAFLYSQQPLQNGKALRIEVGADPDPVNGGDALRRQAASGSQDLCGDHPLASRASKARLRARPQR